MKIHLAWIRATAVATVAAVGFGGGQAPGQYVPFSGVPQYSNTAPDGTQPQQQSGYPSTQQQAYRLAQQQAQTSVPQGPYAALPQYQPPRYQAPAALPADARPATMSAAGAPTVAQQRYAQLPMTVAMQDKSLPPPEPAISDNTLNGSVQPSDDPNQVGDQDAGSPYPTTSGYYGSNDYADGNSNNGADGYYSNVGTDYGVGNYFDPNRGGTQWYGGVYYLFMSRDNPGFHRLTARVDTGAVAYPYYPPADETVLHTPHADHDYRSGFEVRFGSTFSTGGSSDTGRDPYGYGYGSGYGSGYGDCGCNSCATQIYAWEIGYWLLDDDINTAIAIDTFPTDVNRMYGMKNFAGVEYDRDGAGGAYTWRPVNDYYDYQVPVTMPVAPADGDVRVLAQRVRTNFQAQNLELNFLRLPVIGGSSCNTGWGYDSGGYGDYSGYGAPACGSPWSITGLCGVRYIRLDDDFEYATKFGEYIGGGAALDSPAYTPFDYATNNELFYDVNVDNHLTGFQLGANMNYSVSSKFNLFWDTNLGIYNNHMKSYQRVYSGGGGTVRFVNGGGTAEVRSNKDDVAFVGEMRIGGSYDVSCHWRAMAAYRAVAISGVALSVDQMQEDFSNAEQIALIDSDGSLVIHGLQVGAECRY